MASMITPTELRAICLSHAWFDLAPWQVDPGAPSAITTRLARGFSTPEVQGAFEWAVEDDQVVCRVLAGDPKLVHRVAERCLSLDLKLTELGQVVQGTPFAWVATQQLGRYLRSPMLFEDAFKITCTTNTRWQQTKRIIEATCQEYGRAVGNHRTFPLPEDLQGATEEEFRTKLRCGYRAKGLLDLRDHALANPSFWLGDGWRGLSNEEFAATLSAVKGLGTMCLTYLGRFYGKPQGFTIDSWVKTRAKELWGIEKNVEGFLQE